MSFNLLMYLYIYLSVKTLCHLQFSYDYEIYYLSFFNIDKSKKKIRQTNQGPVS